MDTVGIGVVIPFSFVYRLYPNYSTSKIEEGAGVPSRNEGMPPQPT